MALAACIRRLRPRAPQSASFLVSGCVLADERPATFSGAAPPQRYPNSACPIAAYLGAAAGALLEGPAPSSRAWGGEIRGPAALIPRGGGFTFGARGFAALVDAGKHGARDFCPCMSRPGLTHIRPLLLARAKPEFPFSAPAPPSLWPVHVSSWPDPHPPGRMRDLGPGPTAGRGCSRRPPRLSKP